MADATEPAVPPPPQPNMDAVGKWWVAWCCAWSACLFAGIGYLISKRHVPSVRIRGLTLTITGVLMLHVYWVLCAIGYVIGPVLPEMTEFWVMSTYLPAGLACFQAANAQLLHVARLQQRYAKPGGLEGAVRRGSVDGSLPWWKRTVERFRRADSRVKMLIYIAIALVFQILLAVFIFCISRKFHPGWGIPGTEAPGEPMQRKLAIGRGWEWIPSIGWQVFWTWICAPYVLFKTRHIKDTHGWRLQTAVCCLSGLPAAPLWLIALYVPAMKPVNAYWIPPQWICASITVMEICTIFIPCYVAARHGTLHAETLAAIRAWEEQKAQASSPGSSNAPSSAGASEKGTFATTLVGSISETELVGGSRRKSTFSYAETLKVGRSGSKSSTQQLYPSVMFTLDSLEQCLRLNPAPLQAFAAHRDFSGENVAFLTAVAEWKRALTVQQQAGKTSQERETERRRFFNHAVRIYASSVSFAYAAFPVNLGWRERKGLEDVFEGACCILFGRRASQESVDSAWSAAPEKSKRASSAAVAEPALELEQSRRQGSARDGSLLRADDEDAMRAWYWGEIPDGFGLDVFDAVERSVKQLVLLDTWPKFVRSGWADETEGQERKRKSGLGRVFGGGARQKRRRLRERESVSVV